MNLFTLILNLINLPFVFSRGVVFIKGVAGYSNQLLTSDSQ